MYFPECVDTVTHVIAVRPLGFDLGCEYQKDVAESLPVIELLYRKIWANKYKANYHKDTLFQFIHLPCCLLYMSRNVGNKDTSLSGLI